MVTVILNIQFWIFRDIFHHFESFRNVFSERKKSQIYFLVFSFTLPPSLFCQETYFTNFESIIQSRFDYN